MITDKETESENMACEILSIERLIFNPLKNYYNHNYALRWKMDNRSDIMWIFAAKIVNQCVLISQND